MDCFTYNVKKKMVFFFSWGGGGGGCPRVSEFSLQRIQI